MTATAVSVIARQEEMLVEVGCGLRAEACAPSVHVVPGQERIDGTDINIIRIACLHRVFHDGLQSVDDVFEPFHVLDVLHEFVHGVLATCQFHLAVLVPECLVTHLCIGFCHFLLLSVEYLVGHLTEVIV